MTSVISHYLVLDCSFLLRCVSYFDLCVEVSKLLLTPGAQKCSYATGQWMAIAERYFFGVMHFPNELKYTIFCDVYNFCTSYTYLNKIIRKRYHLLSFSYWFAFPIKLNFITYVRRSDIVVARLFLCRIVNKRCVTF